MRRFRIVALLLILSLLLIPVTALAGEKGSITYVALGDSVAYGVGASVYSDYSSDYPYYLLVTGAPPPRYGYTDRFYEHLEKVQETVYYTNVSFPGVTSSSLLDGLREPFSVVQGAVYAASNEEDIITISVGGNDVLRPIIDFVEADPFIRLAPGYFEGILMMDPLDWPVEFQLLFAELNANANGFGPNWADIIQDIRQEKGSNADIYVNTVYNPFPVGTPLNTFTDLFLDRINTPIRLYSALYDYKVVDVYKAFNKMGNRNKPFVHGLDDMNVALHPTDSGYKTIARIHKSLLH